MLLDLTSRSMAPGMSIVVLMLERISEMHIYFNAYFRRTKWTGGFWGQTPVSGEGTDTVTFAMIYSGLTDF